MPVLSHEFGVVRPYRTFSVYIVTGETRSAGCLCTSSGWFKHSSNLLESHYHRYSKVCRVLPHEFGVVRLCRTFSNFIFTGEARCERCLCTTSGWFKRIEKPLALACDGMFPRFNVLSQVLHTHSLPSELMLRSALNTF